MLTYFQRGMPPASGSPRNRLPSIRSRVAVDDRRDERRDPRRVVLVVGVEHHHDVGAGREGRVVARLLVAAVAPVLAVDDHVQPELPGDVDGLVARHVVDEDDPVDQVVRDVGVRPLQRPGGVVGGHDDDHARHAAGAGWRSGRGWAGGPRAKGTAARAASRSPDRHAPVCDDWADSPATHEDHAACSNDSSAATRTDPAVAERIPPGQYKTEKFPVLHYGSVPHTDLATWDFKVWGEVDAPFTLTWEQFKELPRKTVQTDIHCVTRWSKLDTTWEGVPDPDDPRDGRRPTERDATSSRTPSRATRPTCRCPSSTTTTSCWPTRSAAQPLELEHGYPLRLLVPKRYFWKSSKWIRGLEFLDHDQLGFWERYGYNNDADPWKEERFSD